MRHRCGGAVDMAATFRGVFLALCAGCCWSSLSLIGKVLAETSADMIAVTIVRLSVLVVGWSVLLFLRDRESLRFPVARCLFLWGAGTASVLFNYVGYFLSLSYLSVPMAVILLYTYPLWTTLTSGIVLAERPTHVQIGASCLIVVGAATAVGSSVKEGWGIVSPLGVLLALAGAVGMALYSLFGRLSSRGTAMTQGTFFLYFHAFALLSLTVMALFSGSLERLMAFSAAQWSGALAVGVVGTLMGYGLYFMALRDISASLGSGVATVELLATLALSALLLGQTPTFWEMLGGGVIVAGIAWGLWGEMRARCPQTPE